MRWTILVLGAVLVACARDDAGLDARDVAESGAATDVTGRPEGADSIPPEMTGRDSEPPLADSLLPLAGDTDSARRDTGYKRPERRPVREIPPLTRPDSTKP